MSPGSEARPSTLRQIIWQDVPLPSFPTIQHMREELQSQKYEYGRMIREYEDNRRAKGKHTTQISRRSGENQRKASYSHQRLLDQMLMMKEQCNAKGFVYGMVTEAGKPVTCASDSLRAWWKSHVMFDITGPAQIENYYKEHSLYSNLEPENEAKSTIELLKELSDPTLGSILSLLMKHCNPPQRKFPFERGLQPTWWPTAREEWWGQTGEEGPPPYRKPHKLKKNWKAAVIFGILKLMSPKFSRAYNLVKESHKLARRMNAKEWKFWTLALVSEAKRYCQEHQEISADEAAEFLLHYDSK